MERYKNLGGDSGVASFEIGADRIAVRFKDGKTYVYTYAKTGPANVDHMKNLASAGKGLNSFINTSVKYRYESKY